MQQTPRLLTSLAALHYSPNWLYRTHQNKAWLDFQYCQTGHQGEHLPERVADIWRNPPVTVVANGEPTYENIGIYDPRTGAEVGKGRLPDQAPVQYNSGSSGGPRVVVFVGEGGVAN